jgi:alpha-galactosidase
MQVTSIDKDAWSARLGDARYDIALRDGQLRNSYFGTAAGADPRPVREHANNRDNIRLLRPEAAVFVGPRADLVLWDRASPVDVANGLALILDAAWLPLRLHWSLTADPATGVLLRQTRLEHRGGAPVDLRGALSVSAQVVGRLETVQTITGSWSSEGQVRTIRPDNTPILLESRSGKTGFEYQPWLAATVDDATVIVQLAASANWHLHVRHRDDGLFISGGLPEVGFQTELREGEVLDLPEVTLQWVQGDLNAATQRLHAYRRARQMAGRPTIPVQFNSWYPFPGVSHVDELKALLPKVRDLGCEVFVLDGSWFQNAASQPGDTPFELTGDWMVHRASFPNGLRELSDACRTHGLGFGIWFEPESVGYTGALHRTHPEWFHRVNGRARSGRQRGILNIGIDAAREHVRDVMLAILKDTGATWIKWDFNEDLLRGGWAPELLPDLQRIDPLIAHVRGLYRLQEELKAAIPGLIIEMCASGGGRFDAATLRRGHTQWMSDEWRPLRNLSIHFGLQLCHPPELCNDWLIEWPPGDVPYAKGAAPDERGDLPFRLHIAMLGSFGLSARIGAWSAGDLARAAQEIAWYKGFARPLVQDGRQVILTPQPTLDGLGGWAAMAHVAPAGDRAVAFVFRLEAAEDGFELHLPGLDPEATYRVRVGDGQAQAMTGRALAAGLRIGVDAPYRSRRVSVERADEATGR